jgi:hypothetical protein
MTRRSGVTLVEVLVAIFVMAIGLIALLTLFPIGMLRMMQAIRDERCSECGYNADKIAIIFDIRNDTSVVTASDMFANPNPGVLPNADPYGESYPILVDPIGFNATIITARDWVGGSVNVLRRRPVTFAAGNTLHKYFTLWDDINFESTTTNALTPPGTPQKSANVVLRDARYSWAYLLRRPRTGDRSVVDTSIIIFDQRSMTLNASLSLEEYVYPNMAYFNPSDNTIKIDYTTVVPPPLRVGDWILDTTFYQPTKTPPTGSAHGYFYRVVAIEELAIPGKKCARYEVKNPIRGFVNIPLGPDPLSDSANPTVYNGTVIVMRGIAEVIEKGPVRLP